MYINEFFNNKNKNKMIQKLNYTFFYVKGEVETTFLKSSFSNNKILKNFLFILPSGGKET